MFKSDDEFPFATSFVVSLVVLRDEGFVSPASAEVLLPVVSEDIGVLDDSWELDDKTEPVDSC